MQTSDLPNDCRFWANEMHRAASVMEEAGARIDIIDGNRAIADTLAASAVEVLRLRDHNAKLRVFALNIIEAAFDGCGWEGSDIQDMAEQCGLLELYPGGYDPAVHGTDHDMDDGDPYFVPTAVLEPPEPKEPDGQVH